MRSWKKIIRRRLFSAVIKPLTTCHQVQLYTIKDKHKQLSTLVESIFARLGCFCSGVVSARHIITSQEYLEFFSAYAHEEFPICGKITKIAYTGEQRLNKQMSIVDRFLQQSTLTPYS